MSFLISVSFSAKGLAEIENFAAVRVDKIQHGFYGCGLPGPFLPMKPVILPSSMLNDALFSAKAGYVLLRSCTSATLILFPPKSFICTNYATKRSSFQSTADNRFCIILLRLVAGGSKDIAERCAEPHCLSLYKKRARCISQRALLFLYLSDLEVDGGVALNVDAELVVLPGRMALTRMPTKDATARPERLTEPMCTAPAVLLGDAEREHEDERRDDDVAGVGEVDGFSTTLRTPTAEIIP